MEESDSLRDEYNKAKQILFFNTYEVTVNNKKIRRVVPSREYYVHQWKWDSAVHAMGLVHIDEYQAYEEIKSLLSGQWKNGFIGHIIFNPDENSYFPGSDFWETERFSESGVISSGITQPPLLAMSVRYLFKTAKNKKKAREFLHEVLPSLVAYHEHLKKTRDPDNNGLLTIIHPWESGTDNSPRWDYVLEKIKLSEIPDTIKKIVHKRRKDDKAISSVSYRPEYKDYYRYIYLIYLYKKWRWDFNKIVMNSPFAVKDILFSSIWCQANESLADLLDEKGDKILAMKFHTIAKQTRDAIQKTWNRSAGIFTDINVSQGKHEPIFESTLATFMPLLAKAVTKGQLQTILRKLANTSKYWPKYPVPSTAIDSVKFDKDRYWRGPTLPMTNFLLIESLCRYALDKNCKLLRDKLIRKTITMIQENGFFEYYDPLHRAKHTMDRAGRGFGSFSWTAAIYIYLLHQYKAVVNKNVAVIH